MIRTEGISRAFGSTQAVADLDLRIEKGETFGFLGPNGAGKTTTTKILSTLLDPDEGQALVAGFDPTREPLEVRKRIGYLPDELPIYGSYTATEFLTVFGRLHGLSKDAARDRAPRLLGSVGLEDVDGKPVSAFSKGMKQRLGLARALVNDPEVLFLDEPASGLDPMGQKEIRELLKKVAKRGSTVFLCSHDLAEVQDVCDRAAIIRDGRLVRTVELRDRAGTVLLLHVQGDPPGLREAIMDLPGLVKAQRRGETIRLVFRTDPDRRRVARTVQEAGAVLLEMKEAEPDLDRIYEETVSEGEDT